MALPIDGYISSALRTTGEIKVGFDDIVTDIARGNPEHTSTRTFEKGAKVKASNDIVFTSMLDGNIGNIPQADDGSNWYSSVYDNVLGIWSDMTGLVSAGTGLYHNGILWRVESDIADITGSEPSDNNSSYSKQAGGSIFDFVVSQYAGGDKTKVAYINAGLAIDAYDWFIDTNTIQAFSKNGATGTFSNPLDFNPTTGIDSGITGTLSEVKAILESRVSGIETNKLDASGVQTVSGSAIFTNADNNINLANIGSQGWEVGDVIKFTGSTNNDKLFTVEDITDANNIVVNYEHRGGTSSKSLVDETATVICSLVCKWYLAPIGLGQGWCTPISSRVLNTPYTYLENRAMVISIYLGGGNRTTSLNVAGILIMSIVNPSGISSTSSPLVPNGNSYEITNSLPDFLLELR